MWTERGINWARSALGKARRTGAFWGIPGMAPVPLEVSARKPQIGGAETASRRQLGGVVSGWGRGHAKGFTIQRAWSNPFQTLSPFPVAKFHFASFGLQSARDAPSTGRCLSISQKMPKLSKTHSESHPPFHWQSLLKIVKSCRPISGAMRAVPTLACQSPDRAPAAESQWRGRARPLLPQTPAAPARAVTSWRSDTASSIPEGRSHKAPYRVHAKSQESLVRHNASLPASAAQWRYPPLSSLPRPPPGKFYPPEKGLAAASHHLCDHAPVPVRSRVACFWSHCTISLARCRVMIASSHLSPPQGACNMQPTVPQGLGGLLHL